MKYEITGANRSATIDDKGVRIEIGGMARETRFIPYSKIVAVSVKKPGAIIAGHIFFQTAADGSNPLKSLNTIPFKGKETYELACKIKESVEEKLQESAE